MTHNVMKKLERQLERNNQLLALAENEEWETFIDELESYSRQFKTLSGEDFAHLEVSLKEVAVEQMAILLKQDRILIQSVQTRMGLLSSEMSLMRKSRQTSRAYVAV